MTKCQLNLKGHRLYLDKQAVVECCHRYDGPCGLCRPEEVGIYPVDFLPVLHIGCVNGCTYDGCQIASGSLNNVFDIAQCLECLFTYSSCNLVSCQRNYWQLAGNK